MENCNTSSHDEHLIRAIICAGLFPGICSVVNSVNGKEPNIPYPWLVFNEKDGHLTMLGGYLDFFMEPALVDTYLCLKRELKELIQKKLLNPKADINSHIELLLALRLLVSGDQCEGRFVFGRQVTKSSKGVGNNLDKEARSASAGGSGASENENFKNQLQTLPQRARQEPPTYTTSQLKTKCGQPASNKETAENNAAQCEEMTKSLERVGNNLDKEARSASAGGSGANENENYKNQLQTLLQRTGQEPPTYTTSQLKTNWFRSTVSFNRFNIIGQPSSNNKTAEKNATAEDLEVLSTRVVS